jgi:anti-anti-sigma factor
MDSAPDTAPQSGRPLSVSCELGCPSVVTVCGDADLEGAGSLREAVGRALGHHRDVVFDLAGVTFADSTFLTVLLQARLTALDQGGRVLLTAPSRSVQRLLSVVGADGLFPVAAGGEPEHP